VRQAIQQFT